MFFPPLHRNAVCWWDNYSIAYGYVRPFSLLREIAVPSLGLSRHKINGPIRVVQVSAFPTAALLAHCDPVAKHDKHEGNCVFVHWATFEAGGEVTDGNSVGSLRMAPTLLT